MAERLQSPDPAVPPPVEVLHIPEPSYMPATMAFGLMIALVGVITSWFLTAFGGIIVLVTLVRWIRTTRSEMAELPLEHEH